jgi:NAD(P)-dependent dehydrogenase (short-subunit alcohol dehydrogenase family)
LGRDIVKAVLAAGDRVVAGARNPADLRDLVDPHPEHALAVRLDVTRPDEAAAAVAQATERFGRLDVVVNNAGYANVGAIEDVAVDDFRAQIETNFFGVVNVTRAALPTLRKQRAGHILQISSIGGRGATPGLAAYQSAKWAVGGFSEILAQEVKPFGVKVTVVEPGGMRTDWAGSSMHIDAISEAYQPTVGRFTERFKGGAASIARGDPAKVAQVLLKIAALPDPPLRFLVGSDAVFLASVFAASRAAEDSRWRELGSSTDTDGLPPFADTEVGKMILASRKLV